MRNLTMLLLLSSMLSVGCFDLGARPPGATLTPIPVEAVAPVTPPSFNFRYALVVPDANRPFVDCLAADVVSLRVHAFSAGDDYITDLACSGGDANQDQGLQVSELGLATFTLPAPGEWTLAVSLIDHTNHELTVIVQPTELTPSPSLFRYFPGILAEPGANFGYFSEGVTPGAMVFKILVPHVVPSLPANP